MTIQPLIDIMAALRDPETGCSWDLKQSHDTLVAMTFEEVAELAEAIATKDSHNTCEELGDILFHLVFYARIAEEAGDFCLQDVIDTVATKMVRRHPHIFAGKTYQNEAEQKADWARIKAEEKSLHPERYENLSPLQTVAHLPVLQQSIAMQNTLARLGFDWRDAQAVFAKIDEEIDELKVEINQNHEQAIMEEYGDVLFAVLNAGRKLGIDPELALRRANHKFCARSEAMLNCVASLETFSQLTLDEKEKLWEQVKAAEKG